MNCTSSTINTSTERNISLKLIVSLKRNAWTKRYMNCSADRYNTRASGSRRLISHAMECIKCVLPRPTPPCRKSGLNDTSPPSDTRRAAAWASSFGLPTTKFSNVKRGSNDAPGRSGEPVAALAGFGVAAAAGADGFAAAPVLNVRRVTLMPRFANSDLIASP